MKTHLLTMLLLFTSSVIALGADRGGFREPVLAKKGTFFHFHVGLLDSTLDPNKHPAPADENGTPAEGQYEESYPDADLYLSSSEKFDSSFWETIVLHLATQPRGKSTPDTFRARITGRPSLQCLKVMLQV